MLHNIMLLAVVAFAAYVLSLCFATFRLERFKNQVEWWKAEGIVIFVLVLAIMLMLALSGGFFHGLR